MGKIILFLDTVTMTYKGIANELHSCAQEMGFGWPDVFIIGMALLFTLFLLKWTIINGVKSLFHFFTMTTQRKYDLEDRKWKQEKELKDNLLDHLQTNKEINVKYVEDLKKLIGIANNNNNK